MDLPAVSGSSLPPTRPRTPTAHTVISESAADDNTIPGPASVRQSNPLLQRLLAKNAENQLDSADSNVSTVASRLHNQEKLNIVKYRDYLKSEGKREKKKEKKKERTLIRRNYTTILNNYIKPGSDLIKHIHDSLVNVLKFLNSAININLAFGKLLFSHTEQARYFHPSMHGEALLDIAVKISNLSDVNNVVEQIARMDLSADLRLPRDNISYSGVMYTDFQIYHSPVYRTNRFKGAVRSIRNCCTQLPGWK